MFKACTPLYTRYFKALGKTKATLHPPEGISIHPISNHLAQCHGHQLCWVPSQDLGNSNPKPASASSSSSTTAENVL